jgi:hypothetical protein
LVVLTLGIVSLSPVLLLWGVVGLPGAIFLTRVHVRDTKLAAQPPAEDSPNPDAEPELEPQSESVGTSEVSGAADGTDVESKESPR